MNTREEVLARAATLDPETLDKRSALASSNYRRACGTQWDDSLEADEENEDEIKVLDVVTQMPLRKSDTVVLSDGNCYSRDAIRQIVEQGVVNMRSGRARLPLTNKEMTDLDYALAGHAPPTQSEQHSARMRSVGVVMEAFDAPHALERPGTTRQQRRQQSAQIELARARDPQIAALYQRWKQSPMLGTFRNQFAYQFARNENAADSEAVAERLIQRHVGSGESGPALGSMTKDAISWATGSLGDRSVVAAFAVPFLNSESVRALRQKLRTPEGESRLTAKERALAQFVEELIYDVYSEGGSEEFVAMQARVRPSPLSTNELLTMQRVGYGPEAVREGLLSWSLFLNPASEFERRPRPVSVDEVVRALPFEGVDPKNVSVIPWPELIDRFGSSILAVPVWTNASAAQRKNATDQHAAREVNPIDRAEFNRGVATMRSFSR